MVNVAANIGVAITLYTRSVNARDTMKDVRYSLRSCGVSNNAKITRKFKRNPAKVRRMYKIAAVMDCSVEYTQSVESSTKEQ